MVDQLIGWVTGGDRVPGLVYEDVTVETVARARGRADLFGHCNLLHQANARTAARAPRAWHLCVERRLAKVRP